MAKWTAHPSDLFTCQGVMSHHFSNDHDTHNEGEQWIDKDTDARGVVHNEQPQKVEEYQTAVFVRSRIRQQGRVPQSYHQGKKIFTCSNRKRKKLEFGRKNTKSSAPTWNSVEGWWHVSWRRGGGCVSDGRRQVRSRRGGVWLWSLLVERHNTLELLFSQV